MAPDTPTGVPRGLVPLLRLGVSEEKVRRLADQGVQGMAGLRTMAPDALESSLGKGDLERVQVHLRVEARRRARARLPRNPPFERYLSYKLKKLDPAWRKPRGEHNKVRQSRIGKPSKVRPGYGRPRPLRDIHPSGYREARVERPQDLDSLARDQAVRVGRTVGTRKRLEIEEKAAAKGLIILNPVRRG
ncbi:MAG: 50S ribosomal protein L32e [Euryarchaeota archaeon]|nr:50S ribosomal protein L32e [Euryarchaeota archaeon]